MNERPMIRAMANTLLDHDTDVIDEVAVITRLIKAGFTSKDIRQNYKQAMMMAVIRKVNKQRGKHGFANSNA